MNEDRISAAIGALYSNKPYGKRGSMLWTHEDTIWSYETAILYRVSGCVPEEIFINVTKYTNTTTRLQDAIMRRFNPNTDKSRIVASVDEMQPCCHGVDLPHTYYELPVEDRYRSNWKMPMGWPTALSEHDLIRHYKQLGHELATFQTRKYDVYTDCCNCGKYLLARILYYRGDTRYKVFKSQLRNTCEFPEVMQHDA